MLVSVYVFLFGRDNKCSPRAPVFLVVFPVRLTVAALFNVFFFFFFESLDVCGMFEKLQYLENKKNYIIRMFFMFQKDDFNVDCSAGTKKLYPGASFFVLRYQ